MRTHGGRRFFAAVTIALAASTCPGHLAHAEEAGIERLRTHLDTLCLKIGARPVGSPELTAALDYAEAQFHAAGLPRIWRQPFQASGWSGDAWIRWRNEGGNIQTPAVPLGRSAPTPREGIEARLVEVGFGSITEFDLKWSECSGAIVLVRDGGIQDGHALHPIEKAANARAAGAAAMILAPEPGRPPFAGSVARRDSLDLPAVCVHGDFGEGLRRGAREDPSSAVKLFSFGALRRHPSRNVIAELPGTGDAETVVLVLAHVDSWDLGEGARDNAAGVAMLLEMARRLRENGPHHRSIRFAALTGEELGLEGSRHYVERERQSLARHVAVLNLEQPGAPAGFVVHGGAGLRAPLTAVYATHRALGLFGGVPLQASVYSDHLPFLLAGVPSFALRVQMNETSAREHSRWDRRERIDVEGLNDAVELATAAVGRLAARETPAIPHLSDEELEDLLAPWGLDLQRLREAGD